MAIFGTSEEKPRSEELRVGPLELLACEGAISRVMFDGVEVIRAIDMPVRDADWATVPRQVRSESIEADGRTARYSCTFNTGSFEGELKLDATAEDDSSCRLDAKLDLTALNGALVNRAGFILLHPLAGVVGEPLEITQSDGSVASLRFPRRISPGQPAFDMVGMSHVVDGVEVRIAFEGEIFEMEDQRNWSDASYKTYCRPLAAPRPFDVAEGETIRQAVRVDLLRRRAAAVASEEPLAHGVVPAIEIAMGPALDAEPVPAALQKIPGFGLQLRIRAGDAFPANLPDVTQTTLEVVLPAEAEPGAALSAVAEAAKAAGFRPDRVIVLPGPYLSSIQPEGPWPQGTNPEEAAAAARMAFPGSEVGGGMLTNFTEFNRCRPDFETSFVTFGTTAIVHDAGDRAVMETLEALPDIFATARDIGGHREIRLGLTAIGMRSNPYGAAVAANPDHVRLEMAMDDPRQRGLFAAAFAVGYAARAAAAGIASLAPAVASGPLGLTSGDGVVPAFHVVRALAVLSGAEVNISGRAPGQLVSMTAQEGSGLIGLAANLSDEEREVHAPVVRRLGSLEFADAHAPDWLDTAPAAKGSIVLKPYEVAFLYGDTE